jgi:hypothetical protein
MDTVDSDDELLSPRNQKQPSSSSLPTTRSGLAAALSANARPFYPGDKPDGEDTAASVLEAVVTRAHLEGALSPGDAEVAMQLIKSRNTLLFNAQARFADEPTGLRELVLAVVRAERARRQAVENAHASHDEPSWASLPKPLLNLLQVAESQGLVQHDDAILVCNAFIHNFELVHAGWEVYEDEGDEAELLDTILRVLRSGRLHQQMTLYEEGGSESYEEDGGGVDGDDEEDDYEAGKAVGEDKHERLPEVAISVLRTVAGRLEASGALTAQESDALIELAEEGDPALHACFEVYAADNDLEELLSSLQSLALKVGSKNKGPAASRKFEETESPEEVSSGGDDIAENEDSDQDEAEDPSSRGMAAELFDLLKCLEEDGKLSSSEVNILRTLIDKREPRVLAAYDAYVMFRDVEDLIDTLERIARLALQGSLDTPKENSEDNAKNSSSGMMSKLFPSYTNSGKSDEAVADTDSSNSSSSIGEDEDESLELGNEERKAMLLMLLERGALSHEEVIVLMRKMLVHDDSLVAYAFEEFQHHQDFKTFLTNLKQLADPNASQFTLDDSSSSDSESSHDSELNRDSINDDTNQQDDDDYSDDDENYEDDDDDKEEGNEDEANLGRVFMNVVREMELSEAESMALRLCIARDDPHVRAALEVFKLERDEDDLRDTLKRLSRRTVEGMMREIENNEN